MSDEALLDRIDALLEDGAGADGFGAVMELLRQTFNADRAWLDFPCDPDAPSFLVVAEACDPEYPGLGAAHTPVPISSGMRQVMQDALDRDSALPSIGWQPAGANFESAQHFDVRTRLCAAVKPDGQAAWLLGLHSCRTTRDWSPRECALLGRVAQHLTRALSTALLLEILERESARRATLSQALRISGALGGEDDPRGKFAHDINNVLAIITGFSDLALLALEQGEGTVAVRHLQEVVRAGERGRDLVAALVAKTPEEDAAAAALEQLNRTPPTLPGAAAGVVHTGHRVMVVDDDEAVARFVAQLLQTHGYDVSTTHNPRTAAALLRADAATVDLLITDHNMPQMSGTELMSVAHTLRADLPVIICTADRIGINAKTAHDMGAAAFLTKPLDVDALLLTVSNAVKSNPARQP